VYVIFRKALKPAVKVVPGSAHARTVMAAPGVQPAGPAWVPRTVFCVSWAKYQHRRDNLQIKHSKNAMNIVPAAMKPRMATWFSSLGMDNTYPEPISDIEIQRFCTLTSIATVMMTHQTTVHSPPSLSVLSATAPDRT
jgi:hypothetical protein